MLKSIAPSLRLAMRLLWREARQGQWTIVYIALVLAVTATTGFYFYTERLTRALDQQSAILLGGDLVISSPTPIPAEWMQKMHSLSLKTAEIWLYPSMIKTHNQFHLVDIQAVSPNYPLFGQSFEITPGNVMLDSHLLAQLSLKINDEISIGAANFRVQSILPLEMDILNTGWMIAPKVVLRLSDVPATQTVLPGSRVDYRVLMIGESQALSAFRIWLQPRLLSGQRILDIKTQQYLSRNYLERAQNYIQLVLLFVLLMSGIAIALSIREYLQHHHAYIALWRCLGAKANQITLLFIWQLMMIAVAAGIVGILLGFLLQIIIADIVSNFMPIKLPAVGFTPILLGFSTSLLLLFCYAYPIISILPRTPPLFLWRKQIEVTHTQQNIYIAAAIIFILIYIYWTMGFSLLALFFIDMLLMSIGILFLISLIVLSILRLFSKLTTGAIFRGISQLIHYPESFGTQLTAFTLILMSVLVIAMMRNHLITYWQQELKTNSPNYFAFNIDPNDLQKVQQFFNMKRIPIEGIYPMVRGRIIALNGKPIMEAIPPEARGHNALHRELNLSEMLHYPSDNRVVTGKPWNITNTGMPLISIEFDLAKTLQAHLGDQLTFQVGDQTITGMISNVRTVDWGSLHPNFYIIFPPGMLTHFPSTFITSFHLQATQTNVLNQLMQTFPNITIIDIATILQQLQILFAKLEIILEYLFIFAVGAAILIFATSLLASIDERKESYFILRILGASNRYIRNSISTEFFILAFTIIVISWILAKIVTRLLINSIFNF